MTASSGRRDPVAERRKLAHTLGIDDGQLAMLAAVPADDLRRLREQVCEALFQADRAHFARIAALAKAVPAPVAAKLTEAAIPPLLAARAAELLEPGRAVDMVTRLSDRYAADVAQAMDAARAAQVVASIPAGNVARVSAELARRGEWVVMGAFVTHVGPEALRASVARLDGEQLLRISFFLDDLARLDSIGTMLTDRQLDEMLAAAPASGLWRELAELLTNLSPERVDRLSARYREAAPELHAGYDAAAERGDLPEQAMLALRG